MFIVALLVVVVAAALVAFHWHGTRVAVMGAGAHRRWLRNVKRACVRRCAVGREIVRAGFVGPVAPCVRQGGDRMV